MDLPLLALSDAPKAPKAPKAPEAPEAPTGNPVWDEGRLDCVDKDERRKAVTNDRRKTVTALPTAEAATKELGKFLMEVLRSDICSCNMEPERLYTEEENIIVQFESELHYNKFMMQMMVCMFRDIDVPPDTMTYKIREKLAGSHSGTWDNTALSLLISGHRFANGLYYLFTVAVKGGGTAFAFWAVGTVVAAGLAGSLAIAATVSYVLLIAAGWGLGYVLTIDMEDKWWAGVVEADDAAIEDVRKNFKELQNKLGDTEEAKKKQGLFHDFFVEHKRRVHQAMFDIELMANLHGKFVPKRITKILVGFKGTHTEPYVYERNTEITVDVPGGPYKPPPFNTLDTVLEEEEGEEDVEGAGVKGATAFATNAAVMTAILMTPLDVRREVDTGFIWDERKEALWKKRHLACLSENDKNEPMPASEEKEAKNLAEELAYFVFQNVHNPHPHTDCECNNEPSTEKGFDVQNDKAINYVFESQVHYNQFMIQLSVCSARKLQHLPEMSITKRIRDNLAEGAGTYFWERTADVNGSLAQEAGLIVARIAWGSGVAALALTTAPALAGWLLGAFLAAMVLMAYEGVKISGDLLIKVLKERKLIDDNTVENNKQDLQDLVRLLNKKVDDNPDVRERAFKEFTKHKQRVHELMFQLDPNLDTIVIRDPAGNQEQRFTKNSPIEMFANPPDADKNGQLVLDKIKP